MIVELHGGQFANKGAELMLRTAVAELGERVPGIAFAADPSAGSFDERARLGLRQIFPPRGWISNPRLPALLKAQAALGGRWPFPFGRLADMYGLVVVPRLDAFLDLSGFAYTEQWGDLPTENAARLTRMYRRRGRPVVFLPQAFGPFAGARIRDAIRRVVDDADLIFARDDVSLRHLTEVAGPRDTIFKAPDFSLFLDHAERAALPEPPRYCCIVPNVRMLQQGRAEWGDRYLDLLVIAAGRIAAAGLRVTVVVHETSAEELALVRELIDRIGGAPRPDTFRHDDPFVVKRLLGGSLFVVGSRFHSLASALSRGVPCLALGWSHKYEMLLADFGIPDLTIRPRTPDGEVRERIDLLVDPTSNLALRQTVAARLGEMARVNDAMWDRVRATISPGGSQPGELPAQPRGRPEGAGGRAGSGESVMRVAPQ